MLKIPDNDNDCVIVGIAEESMHTRACPPTGAGAITNNATRSSGHPHPPRTQIPLRPFTRLDHCSLEN